MYKAVDVSRFIISHEHSIGKEISNLRLQKILYFVQAKFLTKNKKVCFSDEMQAWTFGPVVPNVYYLYRIFAAFDIRDSSPFSFIPEKDKNLIKSVLDMCRPYPTYQLVDITHSQDPWKNAIASGEGTIITPDSIRTYFEEQINKNR